MWYLSTSHHVHHVRLWRLQQIIWRATSCDLLCICHNLRESWVQGEGLVFGHAGWPHAFVPGDMTEEEEEEEEEQEWEEKIG